MADLLAWLARQLVDDPDAVRVEEIEREDATVLQLYVADARTTVRSARAIRPALPITLPRSASAT